MEEWRGANEDWRKLMDITPIFEAMLKPKDPKASIFYIIVRVDDPVSIDTQEKCIEFLEKQFPFYKVEGIIEGYKGNVNSNPEVQ